MKDDKEWIATAVKYASFGIAISIGLILTKNPACLWGFALLLLME